MSTCTIAISRLDEEQKRVFYFVTVALACLLSIIFLPVMIIIFIKRKTQAVSFKSPKLIILGGSALYLDAIFNIILLNDVGNNINCYISIFVTMVIHYLAYFCLIYRARRIFYIIKLESMYLDQIYDFGQTTKPGPKSKRKNLLDKHQNSQDNSLSPIMLQAEQDGIANFQQIKDNAQIKLKK